MIGLSDVVLRMWGGFAADPVLASIPMFIFMMVLNFLLGFPFEWIEICLIVLPIFGPILMKYDFRASRRPALHDGVVRHARRTRSADGVHDAPFGATLFCMKGTAPPGVTMTDVYRGMYPFVALQLVGLLLCIYFPSIVLWLPGLARLLDRRAERRRDELPTAASPARDHVALSCRGRKTMPPTGGVSKWNRKSASSRQ